MPGPGASCVAVTTPRAPTSAPAAWLAPGSAPTAAADRLTVTSTVAVEEAPTVTVSGETMRAEPSADPLNAAPRLYCWSVPLSFISVSSSVSE